MTQLTLFDFGDLDMPKPLPASDKAQVGFVRCHEENGALYLCAIDVVMWAKDEDYDKARESWKNAKRTLEGEESQLVYFLHQLKARANDGKMYETDFLTVEQFYSLALNLPGKKTQRFKDAAAFLMARETERRFAQRRQIAYYVADGKGEAWAKARVEAKETTKSLRVALHDTHITGAPQYAKVFTVQNETLFEMSKHRIAAELGLSASKADQWRDYLGAVAQKAIVDANQMAVAFMKRAGAESLTSEAQIQIVLKASAFIGGKHREYCALLNIDPLTGEDLDDQGYRLPKPQQMALNAANRK